MNRKINGKPDATYQYKKFKSKFLMNIQAMDSKCRNEMQKVKILVEKPDENALNAPNTSFIRIDTNISCNKTYSKAKRTQRMESERK